MSNLLLNCLPPASRERILSSAKHVNLPVRTTLITPGKRPSYACFLTSGITSVVVESLSGGTAEVAIVGHESLVGILELLGPAASPAHSYMQMEGSGYRIPIGDLRALLADSAEVRSRFLEAAQQHSLTTYQIAACNRLHGAEARMARWLLMVRDRIERDTLLLTQEFLAQLLGTQRTTVVTAAGALQRKGLITYSRGKITILSRPNLERAACDCYKVVKGLYNSLYKTR